MLFRRLRSNTDKNSRFVILLDVVVVKKSELTRGAREKERERERESGGAQSKRLTTCEPNLRPYKTLGRASVRASVYMGGSRVCVCGTAGRGGRKEGDEC